MTGARATWRRSERGFTLIELLVVVGVVALLAGLAAPALGTLTGANAREAAGRLAGTMRYMFDTAALRRELCRVAIDPSSRAFWAECKPGSPTIARDPRAREDAEDLARRSPGGRDGADEAGGAPARAAFSEFRDAVVGKRELPGRAGFGKIHVEGLEKADQKIAYVYFFPGGRAQRAFVPVVDGANVYTVVLEPFTGRSRVVVGAVEVKE